MTRSVYRFAFSNGVRLRDVEGTLHLAMFAGEGLVSPAQMRLHFGYRIDKDQRAILVDARTHAGLIVSRIFASLLLHEIGEDRFEVSRVESRRSTAPTGKAA